MRPKLFLIVRTVSALAASIGAGAAQLNKIPRTGFLMVGFPPPESAPLNENLKAFHKGLLELGYVEGKNIIIEYQYTKGGLIVYRSLRRSLCVSRWTPSNHQVLRGASSVLESR